ncbi:hypothetical protein [Rhizobium herbae]
MPPKFADYFQRTLLLLANVVFDFHSGGETLDFFPFCAAHMLPDKVQEAHAFVANLLRRGSIIAGKVEVFARQWLDMHNGNFFGLQKTRYDRAAGVPG